MHLYIYLQLMGKNSGEAVSLEMEKSVVNSNLCFYVQNIPKLSCCCFLKGHFQPIFSDFLLSNHRSFGVVGYGIPLDVMRNPLVMTSLGGREHPQVIPEVPTTQVKHHICETVDKE